MIVLCVAVFCFCFWAVFSRRFCDGLVTKHFLIFSAITAMLFIMKPSNVAAGVSSLVFLACGMLYWGYKNRKMIREHLHSHV